jgi:hypothetical protein
VDATRILDQGERSLAPCPVHRCHRRFDKLNCQMGLRRRSALRAS